MKRSSALPYLTLTEGEHFAVTPWTWEGPQGVAVVDNAVKGWDAAVKFSLRRTVTVVCEEIARQLGLERSGVGIEIVVTAVTAGRRLRRIVYRKDISLSGERDQLAIQVDMDSSWLAENLQLTTGLYLAKPSTAFTTLAAQKPGSRLWEDGYRLILEGTSPRPTIRSHSFSATWAGEHLQFARYFVEVRAIEAEESFPTSVTIHLNADFPDYVTSIVAGESEPSRTLFEAVVRTVSIHALENDLLTSVDPADYADGSIGATAATWASSCFPGVPLDSVRQRVRSNPGRFEAQLQSALASTLNGRT